VDLLLLGKKPIDPDQPAGSDVRYDPEFELLQAEIDKLSLPSSSGGIDWQKISDMSAFILAEKSKDLLVASYLAVSQIHTRKIEGLAVGLTVIYDLLDQFWDTLFPPKKRMRGRLGAIEWWIEKGEEALQTIPADSLLTEDIEKLKQDLKQIDTLLQEYLETAPLLRPLERFIDNIPIRTEKKPESEAPLPQIRTPDVLPEIKPKPDKQKPLPPSETEGIASPSDAERILRDAFQTMRRTANYLLHNEDLSNPRSYRWRRIAGWSMIQSIPPSTDGRTQIPAPAEYAVVKSNLNGFKDKGNWEGLLKEAEERLQKALLWLDLNRFAAEALAGMGDKYQNAYDAVCQETGFLICRLPGIENLLFSDGSPLADPETKQWIESIGLGGHADLAEHISSAGQRDEHMEDAIQKAQDLVKKKKLTEAVASLQQKLRCSYSGRERLLWRLGLSQILMNAKQPKLAMPHLEMILQDIDMFRLEVWDPDLALKGLEVVWLGFKIHTDQAAKDQMGDILDRIAKLDAAESVRLGKG
jgi:type VI secretion system protein VasJ